MAIEADRRRRYRWVAPAVAALVAVAGCTTTTLNPTTGLTPVSSGSATSSSGSAAPSTTGAATGEPTTRSATSTEIPTATEIPTSGEVPAVTPSSETEPSTVITPTVATYAPPADATATEGDCPYLTKDQVQADTGQRMGGTRIRAATPAPVCEFVRNDGDPLATVRVLQLDTEANAVAAVDFYVPRDTSNPETRPAGWVGGSVATDDGSTYGVSKGGYAVIAVTNQKQSVYARLLVVHAIEGLGL